MDLVTPLRVKVTVRFNFPQEPPDQLVIVNWLLAVPMVVSARFHSPSQFRLVLEGPLRMKMTLVAAAGMVKA